MKIIFDKNQLNDKIDKINIMLDILDNDNEKINYLYNTLHSVIYEAYLMSYWNNRKVKKIKETKN